MVNKGKSFEKDIQSSAKAQGLWIMRLNDTSLSWQKEKTARFTPKNICDFLMYNYPNLFAIECKSTIGKSIGIQREAGSSEAMIKYSQWAGIAEAVKTKGIYGGFILNFRNDNDIKDNITYYLPIEGFVNFLNESGKSSINKLDCVLYGGKVIKQELKRTHYTYDIENMLIDATKEVTYG